MFVPDDIAIDRVYETRVLAAASKLETIGSKASSLDAYQQAKYLILPTTLCLAQWRHPLDEHSIPLIMSAFALNKQYLVRGLRTPIRRGPNGTYEGRIRTAIPLAIRMTLRPRRQHYLLHDFSNAPTTSRSLNGALG